MNVEPLGFFAEDDVDFKKSKISGWRTSSFSLLEIAPLGRTFGHVQPLLPRSTKCNTRLSFSLSAVLRLSLSATSSALRCWLPFF